jgi:hypothetical protein
MVSCIVTLYIYVVFAIDFDLMGLSSGRYCTIAGLYCFLSEFFKTWLNNVIHVHYDHFCVVSCSAPTWTSIGGMNLGVVVSCRHLHLFSSIA